MLEWLAQLNQLIPYPAPPCGEYCAEPPLVGPIDTIVWVFVKLLIWTSFILILYGIAFEAVLRWRARNEIEREAKIEAWTAKELITAHMAVARLRMKRAIRHKDWDL